MWLLAAGITGVDPTRGPRFSMDSLVLQAAIRNPQRTALVDPSGSLTYAQLDHAATAAAAEFVAHGIEPGTPALIVMANDIASVVAFHGARRAGAVVVVLQTTATPRLC